MLFRSEATIVVNTGQGKVYGAVDPELEVTITGLAEGDNLKYRVSRAPGEIVGEYAITVTVLENPNYNVTATNGIFTISQSPVTITVDAGQQKVYGEKDPELKATVTGALD